MANQMTSSESELWLNIKLAVYAFGYFSVLLVFESFWFLVPPFLVWLGEKMNDKVIQKNNGYMPFRVPEWVPKREYLIDAFKRDPALVNGRFRHGYEQVSEETEMKWAADVFAVPSLAEDRIARFFSAGDLMSWSGGVLALVLFVFTLL